ncbi:MAG: hypothetical protein IJU64_01540 [Bacilli bacterium]|nr:hypothetical protein [Bacilli bacterium]
MRRKIPTKVLLIIVFLVLAFAGTLLFFGLGMDAEHQIVNLPMALAAIPFSLAYPVYIGLEFFSGEADCFYTRPGYHKLALIEMIIGFVLAGVGMLLTVLSFTVFSVSPGWMVFFVGLAGMPGFCIYAWHLFFFALKAESPNKKGLAIIGLVGLLELGAFLAGGLCAVLVNPGFGLFFVASPMGLFILTAVDEA